jgi:hypothetical protein
MRIETFASLVEQIQALPAGPRKSCLALSCNEVAEAFKDLVADVTAAAKTAAPVKAAQPEKKRIKCRRN